VNIFIVESLKGTHIRAIKRLDSNAVILAFTFRPSFKNLSQNIEEICESTKITVKNKKMFQTSPDTNQQEVLIHQYNGAIVDYIADLTKEDESCQIYIGYDNDFTGEYMSALLYYHLIKKNIQEKNIIRIPLIEDGYNFVNIGSQQFFHKSDLLEILNRDKEEQRAMNCGPDRFRMGFRKLSALRHLVERMKEEDPKVQRLSEGTSSATYYTKYLLGEK